jgi:hypothetical protein
VVALSEGLMLDLPMKVLLLMDLLLLLQGQLQRSVRQRRNGIIILVCRVVIGRGGKRSLHHFSLPLP